MNINDIMFNIGRLCAMRQQTTDKKTLDKINAQLNGLYNFKYEQMKND